MNREFCLRGEHLKISEVQLVRWVLSTITFQGAITEVQAGDVSQISDVFRQGEASVVTQINIDSLRFHFDDGKRQISCSGGST